MCESRVVRPLRPGMRLDAAIEAYLHTVTAANTRRGYRTALDALATEFGAECDPALLVPDRVAAWFRTR
ncbi:hypothetical protein [Nocardia sp. NPDC047654]|uniref:hypothetical protein n=1 Tax=Nocardia sp. NPDC047654 TaxID=3364314 RepID=UPI0037184A7D